jgi:hypothetical protein
MVKKRFPQGRGVGGECLSGNRFDELFVGFLVIMAAHLSFHYRLIVLLVMEMFCNHRRGKMAG